MNNQSNQMKNDQKKEKEKNIHTQSHTHTHPCARAPHKVNIFLETEREKKQFKAGKDVSMLNL